jgi:pseudouridine-5'-phosphate glycosidase
MIRSSIVFDPEVKQAIDERRPVVALESTIISHGMPYPKNMETALEVEAIIRDEGAVPATIAVLDGVIRIGLRKDSLQMLAQQGPQGAILKLSRRDLAYALVKRASGATTVAATMMCAELAGISVFVTGGIGGVHREGEKTFDISADLQELAKTRVAVVCAGAKSILDLGLTLEVLETLGVPVIGYGSDSFPSFYSRESPFKLEYRMDDPSEIASLLHYHWMLNSSGGVLIANPIPHENEIPRALVEDLIQSGLKEASKLGISGKKVTPFLLSHLAKMSQGKTLEANIALVKNNAKVGAQLAEALLEGRPLMI